MFSGFLRAGSKFDWMTAAEGLMRGGKPVFFPSAYGPRQVQDYLHSKGIKTWAMRPYGRNETIIKVPAEKQAWAQSLVDQFGKGNFVAP
jgi:hypothetical protein